MWIKADYIGLGREMEVWIYLITKEICLTTYHTILKTKIPFSSNSIQTIFEDRTGILWLGTFSSGLDEFNPESQVKIKHYVTIHLIRIRLQTIEFIH